MAGIKILGLNLSERPNRLVALLARSPQSGQF
jgi:hypothetical protein